MGESAARLKYLRLGREIEALPGGVARDNLSHTHSKLGIFMQQEAAAAASALAAATAREARLREALEKLVNWNTSTEPVPKNPHPVDVALAVLDAPSPTLDAVRALVRAGDEVRAIVELLRNPTMAGVLSILPSDVQDFFRNLLESSDALAIALAPFREVRRGD